MTGTLREMLPELRQMQWMTTHSEWQGMRQPPFPRLFSLQPLSVAAPVNFAPGPSATLELVYVAPPRQVLVMTGQAMYRRSGNAPFNRLDRLSSHLRQLRTRHEHDPSDTVEEWRVGDEHIRDECEEGVDDRSFHPLSIVPPAPCVVDHVPDDRRQFHHQLDRLASDLLPVPQAPQTKQRRDAHCWAVHGTWLRCKKRTRTCPLVSCESGSPCVSSTLCSLVE